MSYQNIMSLPLFDFGDIKKSEATIKNTWNEFRVALANRTFKYDEVDSALTTTFLKVFDDLFANCCVRLERSLDVFQTDGYLARGTKLKALETVSYDRFLPKAEFINEDNRFSPVGIEWLYLAWASDKNLAEQCTIKECRASTGNRFGICLFEINSANKDEKIIDLTLADEMTYEDINAQLENSGKVYLSRCYERSMKNKTSRLSTLMTPSTPFEKFFSRWLISTIVFLVVFLIAFKLADYTRVMVYSLIYPEVKEVILPVNLGDLVGSGKRWFLFNETYQLILVLSIYCFVQSLFVLGSSVWPKNSFLKTFVSVTIIVLIYVLMGMLTGNMLFHGNNNKDYGYIFSSFTEQQVFTLGTIAFMFFALVNWVLAFFRFKESEIIQRM